MFQTRFHFLIYERKWNLANYDTRLSSCLHWSCEKRARHPRPLDDIVRSKAEVVLDATNAPSIVTTGKKSETREINRSELIIMRRDIERWPRSLNLHQQHCLLLRWHWQSQQQQRQCRCYRDIGDTTASEATATAKEFQEIYAAGTTGKELYTSRSM